MRSIILDATLTRGLLKAAAKSGLLKFEGEDADIHRRYVMSSRSVERALRLSLMFDDVQLYAHGAPEYQALTDMLGVKFIEPEQGDFHPMKYLRKSENLAFAQQLAPVLVSQLRNEGFTKRDVDGLRSLLAGIGRSSNYDALTATPEVLQRFRVHHEREILTAGADTAFARATGRTGTEIWNTLRIVETVAQTGELLELAGERDAALAVSWRLPASLPVTQAASTITDNTLYCLSVFLEEVDWFPKVTSIEALSRLRQDRRVVNFREAMQHWAEEVRVSGKTAATGALRQAIRAAMKDLRKVRSGQRLAGLLTLISVPIAVLETVFGIVGPGIALTALSVAQECQVRYVERQHKWAVIGMK